MIIKHGDGTLGFTVCPEGDHAMELSGKFEAVKPGEGGQHDTAKDGRLLELKSVEDPDISIMQYVDLNNEKSLRGFMDILYFSGYCAKMHKKNPEKYPSPENGWEDSTIRHINFAKDLMINAGGCDLNVKVSHTKTKNKDGEERVYANIKKVWARNKFEKAGSKTSVPTSTPPSSANTENEWN